MALPTIKELPQGEVVEVTENDCIFQNRTNYTVYLVASDSEPAGAAEMFKYNPDEKDGFTANGNKLYAMCPYTNGKLIYQEI